LHLAEPSIHLTPVNSSIENHIFLLWAKIFIDAGEKSGMIFGVSSKLEGWLEEAGFVDIEVKKISVPVGGETQLGILNQIRLRQGVFDFSARLLSKILGVRF
jgi:hypothetical protein